MHLAKLFQSAVFSEACLSCICYISLDWVLGIFGVLLKTSYWLQTLILNSFTFYDSRGSVDGGRSQEVLLQSNCTPDTILKLLQSPETQEIKYKKGTIATFGFPLTSFGPKSSQNPTDDMALSYLYDNMSSHQVLLIKDDTFLLPLSSRIFFCLLLSYSWYCFVIWTSSITC